jgi:hypothetical protein
MPRPPDRVGSIVAKSERTLKTREKAGLFEDEHLLDNARSRKLKILTLLVAAGLDVSVGFNSIARYQTEFSRVQISGDTPRTKS